MRAEEENKMAGARLTIDRREIDARERIPNGGLIDAGIFNIVVYH